MPTRSITDAYAPQEFVKVRPNFRRLEEEKEKALEEIRSIFTSVYEGIALFLLVMIIILSGMAI